MKAVGRTDIGKCRKNNEDALFLAGEDFPGNLFIVADGMGGCNAGEVASATAIEAFVDYAAQALCEPRADRVDLMHECMVKANEAVYRLSNHRRDYAEMGTTVVAALLEEHQLYIAHVGDSRAYLLRKKEMIPLTEDHSYVMELVHLGSITREEAAKHPKRNIITRAVGIKETVEEDIHVYDVKKGDVILLCSDGLSGMLQDAQMQEIIKRKITFEKKAEKLVEEANARGGYDNISLILVEV